jgi:hypothetical protein
VPPEIVVPAAVIVENTSIVPPASINTPVIPALLVAVVTSNVVPDPTTCAHAGIPQACSSAVPINSFARRESSTGRRPKQ